MEQESLAELSVNDFLERLASDAPTPGAGSVAALAGALAAGLGRMAGALAAGRTRRADLESPAQASRERLERAAAMLRRLIDEHAAACLELSAALELGVSDAARGRRVSQAALLAAGVPLETAAITRGVLLDLRRLWAVADPGLRADLDAGTHLAQGALHAAAASVRASLPLVQPQAAARIGAELERLLEI